MSIPDRSVEGLGLESYVLRYAQFRCMVVLHMKLSFKFISLT